MKGGFGKYLVVIRSRYGRTIATFLYFTTLKKLRERRRGKKGEGGRRGGRVGVERREGEFEGVWEDNIKLHVFLKRHGRLCEYVFCDDAVFMKLI